jgi:hypothetical protein
MKRTLVGAVAVLAIILGIVAYAGAATSDLGTITVTARVNPKLTLSLPTTPDVDLGTAIDPDNTAGVTLAGPQVTVKSNQQFRFAATWTQDQGGAFTDTYADTGTGLWEPRDANARFNGSVKFVPRWDLGPGDVVGTLQFSATQ